MLPAGYRISEQREEMDLHVIHQFLSQSYWAKNIPLTTVEKALNNSLCFALRHEEALVGFARFVTDRATFAYLADVFILPAHRGRGLSRALLSHAMAHEDLQGLRRMMLATADAHGLYRQYGFAELAKPERMMECHQPEIYLANTAEEVK